MKILVNDLLRTPKAIAMASVTNRRKGKELDIAINLACVSAIVLAHNTGDVRPLRGIISSMAKGHRVNAIKDFIMAYACVSYDEEAKQFDYDAERRDYDFEKEKYSGEEQPFNNLLNDSCTLYKPETGYKPVIYVAKLETAIKEATARNKTISKGKALGEGDVIDIALVRATQALIDGDISALKLYITMLEESELAPVVSIAS